ncbi:LytR/AlgR family response regulator transcription factor [Rheinheimera texasensis]|uniref:LytR/AlgR family response regulator transcription factor n=1 Tax=Rheinheimera texasensis TaxID=306205 RepID=UPI000AAF00B4|nr:LytTR family DNA-binding domain-containing protein [Rheinheimera texasensis]
MTNIVEGIARRRDQQWWVETLSRRPLLYAWLVYAVFILLNNSIEANTVWLEHSRDPLNTLDWWEPWLWEISSAIGTLVLAPLLFLSFDRQPLRFSQPLQQCLWHLVVSTLFCFGHVALMVAQRELVYGWLGQSYDFGPLARELWYEYRKDVWGYLNLLVTYQLCAMVWRRLRGEASMLAVAETETAEFTSEAPAAIPAESTAKPLQHLLVKKLDKEFLLAVSTIEYLEACGNYVNLHSHGRIYPLRSTLSQLIEQLAQQGFSRVHRSYAVNHAFVAELSYEPSGDGDIRLSSGVTVPLSRRYKDEFRAGLLPGR